MRKKLTYGLLLLFLAIQFKPVDRSNPEEKGSFDPPKQVAAILKKACYDCHSNEVVWPWYGYIAPISWKIEQDVVEGRAELNFSLLHTKKNRTQAYKLTEVREVIEKGEMPLDEYTWTHRDAILTDEEKKIVSDWCRQRSTDLKALPRKK